MDKKLRESNLEKIIDCSSKNSFFKKGVAALGVVATSLLLNSCIYFRSYEPKKDFRLPTSIPTHCANYLTPKDWKKMVPHFDSISSLSKITPQKLKITKKYVYGLDKVLNCTLSKKKNTRFSFFQKSSHGTSSYNPVTNKVKLNSFLLGTLLHELGHRHDPAIKNGFKFFKLAMAETYAELSRGYFSKLICPLIEQKDCKKLLNNFFDENIHFTHKKVKNVEDVLRTSFSKYSNKYNFMQIISKKTFKRYISRYPVTQHASGKIFQQLIFSQCGDFKKSLEFMAQRSIKELRNNLNDFLKINDYDLENVQKNYLQKKDSFYKIFNLDKVETDIQIQFRKRRSDYLKKRVLEKKASDLIKFRFQMNKNEKYFAAIDDLLNKIPVFHKLPITKTKNKFSAQKIIEKYQHRNGKIRIDNYQEDKLKKLNKKSQHITIPLNLLINLNIFGRAWASKGYIQNKKYTRENSWNGFLRYHFESKNFFKDNESFNMDLLANYKSPKNSRSIQPTFKKVESLYHKDNISFSHSKLKDYLIKHALRKFRFTATIPQGADYNIFTAFKGDYNHPTYFGTHKRKIPHCFYRLSDGDGKHMPAKKIFCSPAPIVYDSIKGRLSKFVLRRKNLQ